MKKAFFVAIAATAIIVMGIIGAAGAVQDAYAKGDAKGRTDMRAQMQPELKAQFDKGMKAGVEYEDWFCKNPEVAASLGQGGK